MMKRVGPGLLLATILVAFSGCLDASAFGLAGDDGPSLAQALAWSHSYPGLVVEVDAHSSVKPPQWLMDEMRTTLQELTGRDRVHIFGPTLLPPTDPVDSVGDLVPIHRDNAQVASTAPGVHLRGDTVVLHVVYLAGEMANSGSGATAGVTLYDHGALFLWPDTFKHLQRSESGRLVSAEPDMQRLVLMHEVGHALGLVGRGAPVVTDRMDADHPGHSSEEDSYMSGTHRMHGNIILGDLEKSFTHADRVDLAALAATDPALRQMRALAA